MTVRRQLGGMAWRAASRRFGSASASDVRRAERRYRVDPDWRRTEGGYAARLDTRTTIGVSNPVGRWQQVEPRRPQDQWRSPWKAAGLMMWGSVVGTAWWLGSSKGRGPLSMLHREDESW